MDQSFTYDIALEGSPTTVQVSYMSRLFGDIKIVSVSDGLNEVSHLLTDLQRKELRHQATIHCGSLSFETHNEIVRDNLKGHGLRVV